MLLFKGMEEGNFLDVMEEYCAEEFVWQNSGLPMLCGQTAVRELMSNGGFRTEIPILAEQTHFSADVLHIASRDGAVLTERIDHHWAEDGRDLMTPHICGVAEIREGRISAFRDFYDVACYEQTPTPVQPGFSLTEFRAAQAAGTA